MKQYFTKYLPVGGEIRAGDMVLKPAFHWGENKENYEAPYIEEVGEDEDTTNMKKVKLFLCSRDIHVGDRYLTAPDYSNERTCEDDSYDFSNCLKVQGEISRDALSFVLEGNEFDEDDILFTYRSHEDSYQGYPVKCTLDFYMKYPDRQYPIKIKGPCKHFH